MGRLTNGLCPLSSFILWLTSDRRTNTAWFHHHHDEALAIIAPVRSA